MGSGAYTAYPLLQQLQAIHHPDTAACTQAERAFLRGVEGDCRVPVGAYATADRGTLRLRAFVGSPDGAEMIERVVMGPDPEALGLQVAHEILAAGGARILADLRA